jgi:hypothetical protein
MIQSFLFFYFDYEIFFYDPEKHNLQTINKRIINAKIKIAMTEAYLYGIGTCSNLCSLNFKLINYVVWCPMWFASLLSLVIKSALG